jgi:hypothetical protein
MKFVEITKLANAFYAKAQEIGDDFGDKDIDEEFRADLVRRENPEGLARFHKMLEESSPDYHRARETEREERRMKELADWLAFERSDEGRAKRRQDLEEAERILGRKISDPVDTSLDLNEWDI